MAGPGRPRKVEQELSVADLIGVGLLGVFFPAPVVDSVLAVTGRLQQRSRLLPSRVVVYYVLAMALFASAGYRELFRLLVEGLRSFDASVPVVIPSKSAFSKARERVGSEPLKRLFEVSAEPLAQPGAVGAWYRDWRVMCIDGSTVEVPDTPENVEYFGRPGVSRGEKSAYPRLRFTVLCEAGTRAIVSVSPGPYRVSEHKLAAELVQAMKPRMICLADRGFFGFELWNTARSTGAELLFRIKKNLILPVEERLPDGSFISRIYSHPNERRDGSHPGVKVRVIEYELNAMADGEAVDEGKPVERYRLLTTILDHALAPAPELAALYRERWENETSFRELKITQGRPGLVLRSRKPDGVIQELYGFLNVHYAIRWLLNQAAGQSGADPDRFSYQNALHSVRRKLSRPESFSPLAPDGTA